jgi:hypothetical protein
MAKKNKNSVDFNKEEDRVAIEAELGEETTLIADSVKVTLADGRGNFDFNNKETGIVYKYKRYIATESIKGNIWVNPVFEVEPKVYETYKNDILVKA